VHPGQGISTSTLCLASAFEILLRVTILMRVRALLSQGGAG